MENDLIIDEKVCMFRGAAAGDVFNGSGWQYLCNQVDSGGSVDGELLAKWFKRAKLSANILPGKTLTREEHLLIKAGFCFLQLACVVSDGKRVAVFQRKKKEIPTGIEKITSGYSVLCSWSPVSTERKAIQAGFEAKTGFIPGGHVEIEDLGLGYNEITTKKPVPQIGAGYFFIVHKVSCAQSSFVSGEHGGDERKSGEKFIGFYDPDALYRGEASYENEPIEFQQRMDKLVVEALATGSSSLRSGHLACFNTACRLTGDPVAFDALTDPNWLSVIVPYFSKLVTLLRERGMNFVLDFILGGFRSP